MSPHPRGMIPAAQAQRLALASQARQEAEAEIRAAVVAALKAGGSVREVAAAAGISTSTVQTWGRAGGWSPSRPASQA